MTVGGAGGDGAVVYAGRWRPAVGPGAAVLADAEATPRRLLPLLNEASCLVLADALSFPYEALRPVDRDLPVAAALPALPPEHLEALLGEPLLGHLGPGDRVAASDEAWRALAGARGWPEAMRLAVDPEDPAAVVSEALLPGALGTRRAKGEGRRRAGALAHLLRDRGVWRDGARRTLDVGGRAGPWRHLLPAGLQLVPVAAQAPLPFADESVEEVAALCVLGELPESRRGALAAEMWRVTRPGGLLAVVEDVVPLPGADCPFPRAGLPRLLLTATGRRLVLDRVWSLRFPGEPWHRGAGVSAVKIGGARRW